MKKRLLLADDSVTIQKVVQITFSHDDYELTVVDNGDVAYEKARSQRPDLVLADVFMPGKNGYELCEAIKNNPELSSVPVLLLTGTFEPFDEAKAKSVGADRWIAKPFESQSLISCVEELLALAAQAQPQAPLAKLTPPTPVVAPPPVALVDDFAETELPDDIWANDEFATEVSSNTLGDFAEEPEPFPAIAQDDMWDVGGFESEAPTVATTGSDDLWGSFEPSANPVVETFSPKAEEDLWGNNDLPTSFSEDAPAIAMSPATTVDLPFVDEVEVLEEIDLIDPVAETMPAMAVEDPFEACDFSFAEEEKSSSPVESAPSPAPFQSEVKLPQTLPNPEPLPATAMMPLEASSHLNQSSFSDEQLDLIVERVAGVVISRLSGTLLEKIAWEVVPDLAETLIKEELRKIRESVTAE